MRGVVSKRDQKVDCVAEAVHALRTGADRQKRMSAPDDRLGGIVSVQDQAAPRKNPGEDVARRGDALSRGASNVYGKGKPNPSPLPYKPRCNRGHTPRTSAR